MQKKCSSATFLPADELSIVTSNEFSVADGHPTFNKQFAKSNALESANGYIKHKYREGWNLPAMPM